MGLYVKYSYQEAIVTTPCTINPQAASWVFLDCHPSTLTQSSLRILLWSHQCRMPAPRQGFRRLISMRKMTSNVRQSKKIGIKHLSIRICSVNLVRTDHLHLGTPLLTILREALQVLEWCIGVPTCNVVM